MKANSYRKHFNVEDKEEYELISIPEFEEFEEVEEPKERLDEMESDVRLLQTELHDIERYTPSIIAKITKPQPFAPYLVKVRKNTLQREGPGENYKIFGPILKNDIFKILEEKNDEFGAVWGKLNRGWIPISDCRKL